MGILFMRLLFPLIYFLSVFGCGGKPTLEREGEITSLVYKVVSGFTFFFPLGTGG